MVSKRRVKERKGMTSGVLPDVKSGGTSLEARVTLVSLGLSLVNNLHMGDEKENKKRKGIINRVEEDEAVDASLMAGIPLGCPTHI
jgi:hypothetical protein